MNYLVDSDWVADYLKGRSEALDFLRSLGADRLAISLITFGEIYEGIYYGQIQGAMKKVSVIFCCGLMCYP